MTKMLLTLTALTSLIAVPTLANPNKPKDTLTGFVAAGAFMASDYEGSDVIQVVPLAAARLEYNQYYVQTRGLGARLNVSPYDKIEFGPSFQYRMSRDDDVDNARVRLFREVESAIELGAFVRVPYPAIFDRTDELAFELDILTDVSNAHEGTLVSFGPSYSYSPAEKWRLSASASATYVSENYNETYFGIDANNAMRSSLPRFNAEGGFKDIGVSLMASYQINERWGVIGLAGYQELLGDAADSPIVDTEGNSSQLMSGIGVTYRF